MAYGQVDDLPYFKDFEAAENYFITTKPIRGREALPLRANRRDYGTYYIEETVSTTGDLGYTCYHHGSPLVAFYPDAVYVRPHPSATSVSFVRQITHLPVRLASKRVCLAEGFRVRNTMILKFDEHGKRYISNPQECLRVLVRSGRSHVPAAKEAKAGRYLQAIWDQRRTIAQVAGVATPAQIEEYSQAAEQTLITASRGMTRTDRLIAFLQEAKEWEPGTSVPLHWLGTSSAKVDAFRTSIVARISFGPGAVMMSLSYIEAVELCEQGLLNDPRGVLQESFWTAPETWII